MTSPIAVDDQWVPVQPCVNAEAEFFEILNDFGNPLEALREALSNAVDWGATEMSIAFNVEEINGAKRLVLQLEDNGVGMSEEVLRTDFWGLGYSNARDRQDTIGEKGHGTKIFLRSEHVRVRTQTSTEAFESTCENPLRALSQRRLHEPRLRKIPAFRDGPGTHITITGYNDNERSKFIQAVVKDYLLWFTKAGSVEQEFGITRYANFKLFLKALDKTEFEAVRFGHVFPNEASDIQKLFQERDAAAADWYVKRYVKDGLRLKDHPEVQYQAIISVEGDEIKRSYNPMIRERRRPDTGRYRVSDRYGLWLCKDFIPIVRVNEWITGFGSGSNAYVLLHGFINCQDLKLTANRGTIANTDPKILEELRTAVTDLVSEIDGELSNEGLYTLRGWQEEHRTVEQEGGEFKRRIKHLKGRKLALLDNQVLLEPSNESELFGLFIRLYSLRPDLFEFEPLDYNTTRGIDVIARNRGERSVRESEYWYIELKHTLRTDFNHSFRHIRWIVCWDFDKSVTRGSEFRGVEDNDVRRLAADTDSNGKKYYFLDNPQRATKIQVLRLREFIEERLDLVFEIEQSV